MADTVSRGHVVHVVVVANGVFRYPQRLRSLLDSADMIIAADGGANWLYEQGLKPNLLVGDMDSVRPEVLAALERAGCAIRRHPAAKDETDTELALLAAAACRPLCVTILGALGGRIDHELANLFLLAMPQLADIETVLFDGVSFLRLCRRRCVIEGEVGDTVSLLPLAGDAGGIVTEGLAYPLRGETLYLGPARGVSNVLTEARAEVRLETGLLIVIHTPQRYLDAEVRHLEK
ncbi:MAG: thiamine diphosphokinase [Chloroflexi bacterium]|nr:thiamine diphosphokinase [Chloroflexota bacterium]